MWDVFTKPTHKLIKVLDKKTFNIYKNAGIMHHYNNDQLKTYDIPNQLGPGWYTDQRTIDILITTYGAQENEFIKI